jgi:hypothetical protein
MNPFLKKEWEEIEIPESAYTRARDRAWERLAAGERPAPRLRFLVPAAALAASVLAVWIWQGQRTREAPRETARAVVPAPLAPSLSHAAVPAATQARPPLAAHRRTKPREQAVRSSRLVLNFVLPQTGVRMIWIMDKKFDLDGGTE